MNKVLIIDGSESYGLNPFSKMAKPYYGKDVVNQFKKLHFTSKPGTAHYYNSMATALPGVARQNIIHLPIFHAEVCYASRSCHHSVL